MQEAKGQGSRKCCPERVQESQRGGEREATRVREQEEVARPCPWLCGGNTAALGVSSLAQPGPGCRPRTPSSLLLLGSLTGGQQQGPGGLTEGLEPRSATPGAPIPVGTASRLVGSQSDPSPPSVQWAPARSC